MKSIIAELPIGIIVCHPVAFFKEYNYRTYMREMERMNVTDRQLCYRVMKKLNMICLN